MTRSNLAKQHGITEHELLDQNITTNDICQRFRVTRRSVYRWRNAGLLKGHKLGRHIVYSTEEVEALEQLLEARDKATHERRIAGSKSVNRQ